MTGPFLRLGKRTVWGAGVRRPIRECLREKDQAMASYSAGMVMPRALARSALYFFTGLG